MSNMEDVAMKRQSRTTQSDRSEPALTGKIEQILSINLLIEGREMPERL